MKSKAAAWITNETDAKKEILISKFLENMDVDIFKKASQVSSLLV